MQPIPIVDFTFPMFIVEFKESRSSYPYASVEFVHGKDGDVEVWTYDSGESWKVSRQEAARMIRMLRKFSRDLHGIIRMVY